MLRIDTDGIIKGYENEKSQILEEFWVVTSHHGTRQDEFAFKLMPFGDNWVFVYSTYMHLM